VLDILSKPPWDYLDFVHRKAPKTKNQHSRPIYMGWNCSVWHPKIHLDLQQWFVRHLVQTPVGLLNVVHQRAPKIKTDVPGPSTAMICWTICPNPCGTI